MSDTKSTSELLEDLLDTVPGRAIQISKIRLGGATEYRVGWETRSWPYVAGRQHPELRHALHEAIEHATEHKTSEYRRKALQFGPEKTVTEP